MFCYVYQQERWSVRDSYLLCSVMCTSRSAGVYVIVFYYMYQQERWSVHDSYLLCSVMCTGRSGVYVIVIYCVLLCVPAGALEYT